MDLKVGDEKCSFVDVCNALRGTVCFTAKLFEVALELGVPSDVIWKLRTGLNMNTYGRYDALHEILQNWSSKESDNARLIVLIGVLESCGDSQAADKLSTQFHVPRDRRNITNVTIDKFPQSLYFICTLLLASVLVMYLHDHDAAVSSMWSQLDNSSKEELLEKLVNVSGKSMTLGDVLKYAGLETHLDEQILLDLKADKQPDILDNTFPGRISYYVPRRLSSRRLLKSEEIFKPQNDVFVFTGIARHELSKFAVTQSTDTSTNQRRTKSTTVKYMVLDMKSDFDELAKKDGGSLHWIEYDGGKFYWAKSSGDLQKIHTSIESRVEQVVYEEDEFNEIAEGISDLPVVISDTPGMGKTLLLANLGRKLVSQGEIVLFGTMSKVALKSKMDGDTLTQNAVIDALSSLGGQTGSLANAYLKKALTSDEVRINVMLDGFDEVSSGDRDMAKQILKIIKSLPSTRLWVTTRPQLLEDVENCLQVLGFNILPFTRQNQRDFLVNFWGQDARCMEKRLEVFADHSLDKLHNSMRSEDHDIAGVPLQCMLIGEVLKREAMNYADPENLISEMPPSIEINSISELYQRLIDVKLDKYFKREDSNKITSEELLSAHIHLSVQLLFPDLGEKGKKAISGPVQQEDLLNVGLLELMCGEEEQKLAFIHRTIAEFFVGLLAVQILNGKRHDRVFGALIDDILESESYEEDLLEPSYLTISHPTHRFKHPVIAYFLNSLIGQNPGTQPQCTVNADLRTLAHSCVNGGHRSIFMLFHDSFNGQASSVFDKHLVVRSVRHSCLELVKLVCETYEKVHGQHGVRDINFEEDFSTSEEDFMILGRFVRKHSEKDITILDLAVMSREYSVVEYLINWHGFRELIEGSHPSMMMLIHHCVEMTLNLLDASAYERIQVIKLLHQLNHGLLEYRNSDDETPLLCWRVHKLLIIELLSLGADILTVDNHNDTILHKVPYNLNADDYHELVTSIPREALAKLLQMRDDYDNTALHNILEIKNPDPCTLWLFKDLGADFNAFEENGWSVLEIAILKHQNIDVLEQLVLHGADWRRTGKPEWTSLHTAVKKFNFQAFKYLCLKIVGTVNDLNAWNDKIRDYLPWQTRDTECLDLRKILLEANGWADLEKLDLRMLRVNVNVKSQGYHLVEHTNFYLFEDVVKPYETDDYRYERYEVAKLLLRSGGVASIPRVVVTFDDSKLSPELLTLLETHGAIRSEKDGSFFLRYTAISMTAAEQDAYEEVADRVLVNWPLSLNEGGFNMNTPLHYAVKHEKNLGARYLLRKGGDVNAKNSNGDTPLHLAITSSSDLMVRLLTEHGADLNAINNDNQTPLKLAKAK